MDALGPRFEGALAYAFACHRGETRKGTEVPYIAHPLAVAALVLEGGGDEDQAIGALLHDVLEDAPDGDAADRRREEIRDRFGERVLGIVEACTDGDPRERERSSWRDRKERYLRHLAQVDSDVLLVSAADKLHNARAILRDYRRHGESIWARFNADREGVLWYYRTLADRYGERYGGPIVHAFQETVEEIRKLAR